MCNKWYTLKYHGKRYVNFIWYNEMHDFCCIAPHLGDQTCPQVQWQGKIHHLHVTLLNVPSHTSHSYPLTIPALKYMWVWQHGAIHTYSKHNILKYIRNNMNAAEYCCDITKAVICLRHPGIRKIHESELTLRISVFSRDRRELDNFISVNCMK